MESNSQEYFGPTGERKNVAIGQCVLSSYAYLSQNSQHSNHSDHATKIKDRSNHGVHCSCWREHKRWREEGTIHYKMQIRVSQHDINKFSP